MSSDDDAQYPREEPDPQADSQTPSVASSQTLSFRSLGRLSVSNPSCTPSNEHYARPSITTDTTTTSGDLVQSHLHEQDTRRLQLILKGVNPDLTNQVQGCAPYIMITDWDRGDLHRVDHDFTAGDLITTVAANVATCPSANASSSESVTASSSWNTDDSFERLSALGQRDLFGQETRRSSNPVQTRSSSDSRLLGHRRQRIARGRRTDTDTDSGPSARATLGSTWLTGVVNSTARILNDSLDRLEGIEAAKR
jgi:hypothetical protein